MNPIIAVQCHHTDLLESDYRTEDVRGLDPRDPDGYSVGPLARAGIGPVVLAAPDLPENRAVFPELAERWGVELHLGDVHDVSRRLAEAARERGADVLARVVMTSFYVDPEIVRGQIELHAAERTDYCALPRDFNINFGADVVTVEALERLPQVAERLPEPGFARYRPWPFLEALDEFTVSVYDDLPEIAEARVQWIRSHPNWPERAGPGCEGGEYRELARDYVKPGDSVLDAGCGHGEITSIVAERAGRAMGVDYDAEAIRLARDRFPQLEFERGDLARWRTDERFDVILHTHVLEHLPEPVAALRNLGEHLKPGGKLVVEVPLLVRPGIVNPHHEREYTPEVLAEQIREAGLGVVETRGVTRGVYSRAEAAREAFVAVCRNGSPS
ncbi:MAG: methyltransferase domain-containing protein [Thermoleophilaceae bacterium]